MKRNKYLIILIAVLLITALYFVLSKSSSTIKREYRDFAIEDTSAIQKIFIADKKGKKVTIVRVGIDRWVLSDSAHARPDLIKSVLVALKNVTIVAPVSSAAYNNVIKAMASNSAKVEVYVNAYRVNFFGKLKLFPYLKLEKTFYVGDPTQDHAGTYMMIENSSTPFITFIPGFDGYLTTRYSANPDDWRTREIANYSFDMIKSISIDYPRNPENSYVLEKMGGKAFTLTPRVTPKESVEIDSVRVYDYITGFYKLNFEEFVTTELSSSQKDSVLKSPPYVIIKITDVKNKTKTIKTYLKKNPFDETAYGINEIKPYDLDRLFALINEGKDLVLIQYFMFDRVFKKYSDFMKGHEYESAIDVATKMALKNSAKKIGK